MYRDRWILNLILAMDIAEHDSLSFLQLGRAGVHGQDLLGFGHNVLHADLALASQELRRVQGCESSLSWALSVVVSVMKDEGGSLWVASPSFSLNH